MDTIVQLIRNGLCCIKDLDLFRETVPFLYDPKVTASYLGTFPEPLDQTTPLEVMISIAQFYAFVSCVRSGFNMLMTSLGKVQRIQRLIDTRTPSKTDADRLINASLVKEGNYATRSALIGLLVAFIGASFFWLAANSWHVTETDWIGGVPALIHALTVAEMCLFVLLYFMWMDAGEQMNRAARMQRLARVLRTGTLTPKEVGLPSFEVLTGWVPFWDKGVHPLAPNPEPKEEEKLIVKEQVKVLQSLRELVGPNKSSSDKKTDAVDEKEQKEEKERRKRQQEKAEELLDASRMTRWEGYREYLYFVLNAIAFYGYMLSVVAYYFNDEETKHHTVRHMMFHLESHAADWHGNFAGDLMWTIEPVVVMASPVLFSLMKPQPKKVKSE